MERVMVAIGERPVEPVELQPDVGEDTLEFDPVNTRLQLSSVQKITSIATRYVAGPGTKRAGEVYYVADEPNGFGIPAVETCPGRTDICQLDCYAIESERRGATAAKMRHNYDALLSDPTVEGMAAKLGTLVDDYRGEAEKLARPDGTKNYRKPEDARHFRIHWNGDFFSVDYAKAWRMVIEQNPDINFFLYTRSFQPDVNVIPVLAGIKNLDLFMSVDHQNVDRAAEVLAENPDKGVKVAYLVEFQEEADELIQKLGRDREDGFRHRSCPENMRKENGERVLPLVDEKGGACSKCTYCIDKPGNWDVVFVKKGLVQRPNPQLPIGSMALVSISRREELRERRAAGAVAAAARPAGVAAMAGIQGDLF